MVNRFKLNLINVRRRGKKERKKNEGRKKGERKEGRKEGRRQQEERMEVTEKSEKYNYMVQNEEVRVEW